MTRFLINIILMLVIGFLTYLGITTFFPDIRQVISIPTSIFIGIFFGFFIYIQIDNRMGP